MTAGPAPLAYDVKGAVEVSSLSETVIRTAIYKGQLRAKKQGRRFVILHTELVRYLEEALPDYTGGDEDEDETPTPPPRKKSQK